MNKQWTLDRDEVAVSWSAGGPKRRTNVTRQSRAQDLTSGNVSLTHLSTGVEVTGEIPEGHYTRKQLKELRHQLTERLFAQLESIVAKTLGIPGR